MRIMGLLVTCVMAWAVSLGVMTSVQASGATPPAGEISQCLIPMGTAAPPLVSCSDHLPAWLGLDRVPDPQ